MCFFEGLNERELRIGRRMNSNRGRARGRENLSCCDCKRKDVCWMGYLESADWETEEIGEVGTLINGVGCKVLLRL